MMTFPELIRSQEEVLRRLLLVSQHQLEIVERGDPTVLLIYLEQRNQLWGEFELLDEQLAPHKVVPPAQRVWKSAEERQLTELALKRSEELLKEIMANDQISFAKAEELKNKVEKDLRRVQLGKAAALPYAKQSQIQR